MKYLLYFILVCLLLTFWGCAGTTEPDNDNDEAFVANLLEHNGDTGDIIKNSYGLITDTLNCYYSSDSTFYEREDNGIDAYFEGDWILVPWRHISDPETVSLELFRFSYMDYQNNVEDYITSVAFIPFHNSTNDYYLDTFKDVEQVIDNTWLYFLKTTNANGATALSDTVGYRLVNKPALRTPADLAVFSTSSSIIFEWDLNTTSSLVKHRLLLFDESYNLIWFYNLLSNEEPYLEFEVLSGIELVPGNYIWRVDGIIEWVDEVNINGKLMEIYSGSESMERLFTISGAKK
ncbi:MAG: hypothetical protein K9M99_04450 [Candidatus Cloacimonetes bacterium]|nr:hypothetical protein [Candidatus Cloacimonadota bacterium]